MSKLILPYRLCVGVTLCNSEGKIFVGKRLNPISEAWQMPQGGIDPGEDPFKAATRELFEETGVRSVTPLAETARWTNYRLPEDLIPQMWNGRYAGQRQKWFLFLFHGQDSEINIEGDHPEFAEWRWETPQRVEELIVPFKKELYARVLAEFSPHLLRLAGQTRDA